MAKYLMIESSSGFVENIILWDGLIEEWNTSSGFILQEVTDTEPMDFVITDNNINFSQIPRDLLDFVASSSLSIFPPNITGYIGSFTGSLTGSFNDYSGSLGWLDEFASSSRSGSFTGSFTGSFSGSLTGSFNGYSGDLSWVMTFPTSSWGTASFTGSFTGSHSGNGTGSYTGSFTGSLLGTSSNASTASYVTNIKSGKVTSGEWVVELVGNNYTASVLLSSSYLNDLYSVSLTCGADIRTLSVTNKTPSGFDINSNSTSAMTDDVYWVTVPYNNP